jgi:hypothetical protein
MDRSELGETMALLPTAFLTQALLKSIRVKKG